MKKVFLALVLVILLSGSALGVSSDDVYLRKDVFDAKMDAFMSEIRLMNEQMRREMQEMKAELHQEIQSVKTELHEEIQSVKTELHEEIQSVKTELHEEIQAVSTRVAKLETRVDSMDKSLDRSISILTLIVTFVGVIVGFAIFAPALLEFVKGLRKAQVVQEDSERLNDRIDNLVKQEVERLMKMQLSAK